MGQLVGEAFDDFVKNQITIRQQTAGSGFDGSRTPEQLQIQNNQNSFLKLGSSVRFLTTPEIVAELKLTAPNLTEEEYKNSDRRNGADRIEAIGLTNPENFMGNKLAKKTVLFNSTSEVISSVKDREGKGTQGTYNFRSGVSQTGDIWNNSNAYGLGGSQQGLTPPPGLIDAKVEALNRGSIRKATVNIKAHNKFQFELIELLYLRLGYTMLLEWGNDKFINNEGNLQQMGNTLMEDIWFQDFKTYNFTKLIKDVGRYRETYSGNYDGFIGKVSNFSWDFDRDGTYNITLNLISVGDVIESIKVNNPADIKTEKEIEEILNGYDTGISGIETSLTKSSLVTNAGTSPLAYDLFTDIVDSKGSLKWWGYKYPYLNLYWSLNLPGEKAGGDMLAQIKSLNDGEGVDIDRFGYYLTLGELLQKIKTFCIPKLSNGSMLDIDTNVDETIMSAYPNQISLNPKIALVKPKFLDDLSLNNYNEFAANKTGIKSYWDFAKRMNDWMVTENDGSIIYGKTLNVYLNYDFISNALDKVTKKGEIYLFKFLQEICDGINGALGGVPNLEPIISDDNVITIQDQNRIRGIENSSFKSKFDTTSSFELYGYNLKGRGEGNKLIPTSNIVREFGFKTKIGPDLASMISIGATANGTSTKNYDATAFSSWNTGLRDQYQYGLKDPPQINKDKIASLDNIYKPLTLKQVNELYTHFTTKGVLDKRSFLGIFSRASNDTISRRFKKESTGKRDVDNSPITNKNYNNVFWADYINEVIEDIENMDLPEPKELQKFADGYIRYLIQGFRGKILGQAKLKGYYFHLNDEYIKQGQQSFKGYVNILDNALYVATGTPSTKIGFIPLNLDLTCDGISGVKMYQKLNIRQEFLPQQYPDALEFLISKVNHTISNNDWTTSLTTISTPKTKEQNIGAFINTEISKITKQASDNYVVYKGDAPQVTLTTGYSVVNTQTKSGLIYYPTNSTKNQIVLHHTAGSSDAKQEIGTNWTSKTYPIATHYIIERKGHSEHVFPDIYWSNHLGISKKSGNPYFRNNVQLNKQSLSIELESIGFLTERDGKWYSYVGSEIPLNDTSEPYMLDDNNNVVKMPGGYKGYERYQSYTPAMLSELEKVLVNWKSTYNISIYLNNKNFDDVFPKEGKYSESASTFIGGIYTHNSYRPDKADVFPQKELLELLMKIGNL